MGNSLCFLEFEGFVLAFLVLVVAEEAQEDGDDGEDGGGDVLPGGSGGEQVREAQGDDVDVDVYFFEIFLELNGEVCVHLVSSVHAVLVSEVQEDHEREDEK